jgi:hypothetical protein
MSEPELSDRARWAAPKNTFVKSQPLKHHREERGAAKVNGPARGTTAIAEIKAARLLAEAAKLRSCGLL